MAQRSGDELHELDSRQEPRLVKALEMVAPGPALLYQLAKMDGAITLNANATKITMANVQLMPDPTILSMETGTRHRTAERVAKQTKALVIAISQRRDVVSLYMEGA